MKVLFTVIPLFFVLSVQGELPPCDESDTLLADGDTVVKEMSCYEDGKPRSLVLTKNGELHGEVKSWYPGGKYAGKTEYASGKRHGIILGFFENGDTSIIGYYRNGRPIGQLRSYCSPNKPERFTNFNDNGDKHGWEIFWYDNGNVKDSILFRNDSTMQRRSYYYNGKPQMFEDDIYGTYDAVSFSPKGKRTGRIKDGTGAVFLCDSVGGDCKELKYKDGKRVLE